MTRAKYPNFIATFFKWADTILILLRAFKLEPHQRPQINQSLREKSLGAFLLRDTLAGHH
jgi:hypothetical protein